MAYEQRDNSGSLFVNDKKTEETHADRAGSIMVAGVEYWLNGWLKKTKDGKPYLSLSVKPKEAKIQVVDRGKYSTSSKTTADPF